MTTFSQEILQKFQEHHKTIVIVKTRDGDGNIKAEFFEKKKYSIWQVMLKNLGHIQWSKHWVLVVSLLSVS